MKKTSLFEKHIELNAKMVDFGGFNMPIQYSGISDEHINVRNNVGIFDVSHMGEFFVSGKEALQFLNHICSNNIEKIEINKAQYNCFTNENGGIIDDLIVYRCDENEYMLVVNASNIDKDWNWLNRYINKYDCSIINESDNIGLISVQGPKSLQLINDIFNKDFTLGEVQMVEGYLAHKWGLTGDLPSSHPYKTSITTVKKTRINLFLNVFCNFSRSRFPNSRNGKRIF